MDFLSHSYLKRPLTLFAIRHSVICDNMFSDLLTKMSFQIQDKVFQHLVWKKCEAGAVPENAFYTGAMDSNEPLYVARAFHKGHIIPGKFHKGHDTAYVSWGGKEHALSDYNVLLQCDGLQWVRFESRNVPIGAIPMGYEGDVPLYSVKGKVNGTDVLGKYHVGYKTCYFPYGGKEVEADPMRCEILVCEKMMPKKFKKLEWENCMGGTIPKNAFDTGATDSGKILITK